MPEPLSPALLDVRDAARYLGVSRTLLYSLLSSGALPSVKVGQRRLVRRADLERFVESLPTLRGTR